MKVRKELAHPKKKAPTTKNKSPQTKRSPRDLEVTTKAHRAVED